jgi:hypothetical protein
MNAHPSSLPLLLKEKGKLEPPLSTRERGGGRGREFVGHGPRRKSGTGLQAGARPAREVRTPIRENTNPQKKLLIPVAA